MSGSRRVLIESDVGGVIPRLVDAAGTFAAAEPLESWALVGGLAVMVQLAEAHRATADIDAAADNEHGVVDAAIDVLIADGRAHYERTQLYVDGEMVDVIRVGALDPAELPDDEAERVFPIAHSWAVSTAVMTDVAVTDVDGTIVTEATFPIATPASLVAAKLGSHLARLMRSDEKKASDVYDIYRLLSEHDRDGGLSATLMTAPEDLATWCADTIESTFVTAAGLWARRLRVHSRGPAMGSVDEAALSVVGSLSVEHLRRGLTAT